MTQTENFNKVETYTKSSDGPIDKLLFNIQDLVEQSKREFIMRYKFFNINILSPA